MTSHANNPNQQMRLQTEAHRGPEFIVARDGLVRDIDAWLRDLAACRDSGQPTPNDTLISNEPLVVREPVAGTKRGHTHKVAEATTGGGVSLMGDGTTLRLELHAVRRDGDELEVIEVVGTDPLVSLVDGDGYSPGGSGTTRASFQVRTRPDAGFEQRFGYEVRGNGSVNHTFVDSNGVDTANNVTTAEMTMATQAFAAVKDSI